MTGSSRAAAPVALCAALLESGDPGLGDAVDLMVQRCGGPGLPSMPGGSFRAKWLELLTRCSIALGRPRDAERAAAAAQDLMRSTGGLRMATAMAERAAATVALEAGDPQARRAKSARVGSRRGRRRDPHRGRPLTHPRRACLSESR